VREAAPASAVLGLAAGLAYLLGHLHPVLAAVPLVMPGAPAALMLWARLRHGDPYDVRYRYPGDMRADGG
jgi:hypothetical protein